jgi:hypothetical protein
LEELKRTFRLDVDTDYVTLVNEFQQQAVTHFLSSKLNTLTGLDRFPVVETTMGCNHVIDSLIMQYGVAGLQIFENDYRYYQRLDPAIEFAQLGQLVPGKPILMAMPSPGWLDVHPRQYDILEEAHVKSCDVHIDCAWIGAAQGIEFYFDHPAIASVCMSLSKGMDLWWNRVGVRWARQQVDTDPVTIYNKHKMLPMSTIQVGLHYLQRVEPDYVWTHYKDRYHAICREHLLRPSKIIHVAQSMDRMKMFGLKNLLEKGWR